MTNVIDVWTCRVGGRYLVHFISARAKDWASCHLPLMAWDKISPVSFDPDEYGDMSHALSHTDLVEIGDETGVNH
jgi:hypothetical protein